MVLDTVSKCVLSDLSCILWLPEYSIMNHGSDGQKKTKSAKNETLFAINRLLQNQLIIPDPSVEFEFSKW